MAALRQDLIDAPWLIEGSIDGDSFRAYVEKVFLPVLRPGDIVVMDNLGSHKGKVVRQPVHCTGANLHFLPKYPSDLKPIERVFAKLKHLLRKAAARTIGGLRRNRRSSANLHTEECAKYLKNSGFPIQ